MSDKPNAGYIKTPGEINVNNPRPGEKKGGRIQRELDLINKLDIMYREGSAAKEAQTENWNVMHDFYMGKHWPDDLPSYKVLGQMNFVQQLIERKAALLTDSMPTLHITPTISDNSPDPKKIERAHETARALEKVLHGLWAEHSLLQRIARLVVYAEIFGVGGTNTAIDRDRGRFGPDPTFFTLDPRAVFVDPYIYCSEDLYKAQYIIFEDLKPTEYLRDLFPKKADGIRPDPKFTASSTVDHAGTLKEKVRKLFGFSSAEAGSALDRTWVREYWLKDYTRSEGTLLYPHGRHILKAGNTILVDEPNPYIDGQWPIDLIEWHQNLNSLWGFGDIELYRSSQTIFNKIMSLIVENAQLTTNSIWIGDADALAPSDWDRLVNEPGLHVKVRTGRSLKREAPPPVSPSLFNLQGMVLDGMEKLSGLPDVMEGRRPGQVTSGAAINSLQTAAQTVIRYKARQLESLLTRIGQKMISRIFQYMDDYRVFAITGSQEQALAFNFDKAKYLKDPNFAFKDFQFNVVPGSSLAINKEAKGLQAVQLYQIGVIKGRKRVLDSFEWPDRDQIEKENKEIEQAEMESQLQMQAAAATIGGSPAGSEGDRKGPRPRGSNGAGGRRNDQLPNPTPRDPQAASGPVGLI